MKTRILVSVVLVVALSVFALAQGYSNGIIIPSPFRLVFGLGNSTGDVVISQTANNKISLASGNTLDVVSADKLTVNSVIVPQGIEATFADGGAGNATDRIFFIATAAYQVTACSQLHAVAAGGTSTLQVVKDTTTGAPGAGTDLLTSAFNLNATANTLQAGALSATVADLQLAAGDRLSVDYANAIQSSVGVTVTCSLKRI